MNGLLTYFANRAGHSRPGCNEEGSLFHAFHCISRRTKEGDLLHSFRVREVIADKSGSLKRDRIPLVVLL